MDKNAYYLLFMIGKCNSMLKTHCDELALRSEVTDTTHWSDIEVVDDAFRLKEFVDAELINGQAISWRLELTVMPESIMVEADVRRIHGEGSDVVEEIADREYQNVLDGSNGIAEITRELCVIDPI